MRWLKCAINAGICFLSLMASICGRSRVAKTPQQQEHLRSLTPGQLTAMERNGTPFFVYPDMAKNQIYVGSQKEYQAYRRLRPDGGPSPQDKLNAQHAADMASYLKQDAAMQKANTRDLSDPYYFWPSFFELAL